MSSLAPPEPEGSAMKIVHVAANNRTHVFEIRTRERTLVLPYVRTDPAPRSTDRVHEVFVDPELGNEGFTYTLDSGARGSVTIETVLEYTEDPWSMADAAIYRLTLAAVDGVQASALSARELSRWLGTSPAQLYRLLDPMNSAKSLRQLLALLYVLGCEVEIDVSVPRRRPVARRG